MPDVRIRFFGDPSGANAAQRAVIAGNERVAQSATTVSSAVVREAQSYRQVVAESSAAARSVTALSAAQARQGRIAAMVTGPGVMGTGLSIRSAETGRVGAVRPAMYGAGGVGMLSTGVAAKAASESKALTGALRETERATGRATAGLTQTGRAASDLGRRFSGVRSTILGMGAAYVGVIGGMLAFRAVVDEEKDYQAVNAQTRAALKSTGGVAGVTAEHVTELGDQLQHLSGIDDEVVRRSENVVLMFDQVRNSAGAGNDVFDQTVRLSADLSRRLGLEMPQAARVLARALQDPAKGVTQLRRANIVLIQSEVDAVKQAMKHGDVLKAQRIILDRVAIQVGGAAEAYGKTLPGQIDRSKEALKNFGREVMNQVAHSGDFATSIERWAANEENVRKVSDGLRDTGKVVGAVFRTLKGVIEGVNTVTGGWEHTLKLLLALKFASWAAGLSASLATVAGAEAAGTGLAGASRLALLLRTRLIALRNLGAITIPVLLIYELVSNEDKINATVNKWLKEHGFGFMTRGQSGGSEDYKLPPGYDFGNASGKSYAAAAGTYGAIPKGKSKGYLQGPHPTAGIEEMGRTALDISVTPGTPVLAPEDGRITRVSGSAPTGHSTGSAGVLGYSIYFVGFSGTTYFLTHLATAGDLGRYNKGQVIGTVAYHERGTHLHIGKAAMSIKFAHEGSIKSWPRPGHGATGTPPKKGADRPTTGGSTDTAADLTAPSKAIDVAMAKAQEDWQLNPNTRTLAALVLADEKAIAELNKRLLTPAGKKNAAALIRARAGYESEMKNARDSLKKETKKLSAGDLPWTLDDAIKLAESQTGAKQFRDLITAEGRAVKYLEQQLSKSKEGTQAYSAIKVALAAHKKARDDARKNLAAFLKGDIDVTAMPESWTINLENAEAMAGVSGLRRVIELSQQAITTLTARLKKADADNKAKLNDALAQHREKIRTAQREIAAMNEEARSSASAALSSAVGLSVTGPDEFGSWINQIPENWRAVGDAISDGAKEAYRHLKHAAAVLDTPGILESARRTAIAEANKWGQAWVDGLNEASQKAAWAAEDAASDLSRAIRDVTNGVLQAFDDQTAAYESAWDKATAAHVRVMEGENDKQLQAFDDETDAWVESFNEATDGMVEAVSGSAGSGGSSVARAVLTMGQDAEHAFELSAEGTANAARMWVKTVYGVFSIAEGEKTPAEKEIERLQKILDMMDAAASEADARQTLAQAMAKGDAKGAQVAQRELDRLQIQEQIKTQETRAEVERKAADAALEAQRKAAEDAQSIQNDYSSASSSAQQKAIEKQRSTQLKAYERSRAEARKALETKLGDDVAGYEEERGNQLTAWGRIRDGERTQISDSLSDWDRWLGERRVGFDKFLNYVASKWGFQYTGKYADGSPAASGSGGIPGAPSSGPWSGSGVSYQPNPNGGTDWTVGTPGDPGYWKWTFPFAKGGMVPGVYVGREDTVAARLTPGETVIDRKLTNELTEYLRNPPLGGQANLNFYGHVWDRRQLARDMRDMLYDVGEWKPTRSIFRDRR